MILVTGATGYIGSRLAAALVESHRPVRCFVRDPGRFTAPTGASVEIARGDLRDLPAVEAAMLGVETAFYLVHSMAEGPDFQERERAAAANFAAAARRAGVKRIVYLGGLAHGPELSPHLNSRREVGEILRSSGVPVIEFRASIVLGAGSLSFELIRALVERLPVMITPRWVSVLAQPISISDLLRYLIAAVDLDCSGHRIFEIGGADQVSYGDLMREYAAQRGLRRLMLRAPVLTPRLSSLWLRLVTPVYAGVGRYLIDSIRYPTVVEDDAARKVFPIQSCGIAQAIRDALLEEDRECLGRRPDPLRKGARLTDARETRIEAKPEAAFEPIVRIGRNSDWYYANAVWRLRGLVDRMFGGGGNRWRVEILKPPCRYVLRTEMKLPGRGWLDFEVMPDRGGAIIRQTAVFDPRGVLGRAYWYVTLPIHRIIFSGMLARIASLAEA